MKKLVESRNIVINHPNAAETFADAGIIVTPAEVKEAIVVAKDVVTVAKTISNITQEESAIKQQSAAAQVQSSDSEGFTHYTIVQNGQTLKDTIAEAASNAQVEEGVEDESIAESLKSKYRFEDSEVDADRASHKSEIDASNAAVSSNIQS